MKSWEKKCDFIWGGTWCLRPLLNSAQGTVSHAKQLGANGEVSLA